MPLDKIFNVTMLPDNTINSNPTKKTSVFIAGKDDSILKPFGQNKIVKKKEWLYLQAEI